MNFEGHLMLTVRPGEARSHIPAHLDCLAGAARPAGRIYQGPMDAAIKRYGGGSRAACVFHARESLGQPGQQHMAFDDVEESLGLSRTYRLQIAEPEGTTSVLNALRDLHGVESVGSRESETFF